MAQPTKGRRVTWSPQGWLLNAPGERVDSSGGQKLTFAQITVAIMDTVKEASLVAERDVTDAIEKAKFLQQISLLKSAGAQYVSAGQLYNTNPTPENSKAMDDADAVLGHCHSNILSLMLYHSEKEFTVDPNKQKQYLLRELEAALTDVKEWNGQMELMQIDADAFYKAADRLLRAQVSIIKNVIADRNQQVAIAQNVKDWGADATRYRDIYLPRKEKKWETIDVYPIEEKLFKDLERIQTAIHNAI